METNINMKKIKVFTENTEKQMQDALDAWIKEVKPNIDEVTCAITIAPMTLRYDAALRTSGNDTYLTLMVTVSYW